MTAREFITHAGFEASETALLVLTHYIESPVDFVSFPDADITTADGEPLEDLVTEPAGFQEYVDHHFLTDPGTVPGI